MFNDKHADYNKVSLDDFSDDDSYDDDPEYGRRAANPGAPAIGNNNGIARQQQLFKEQDLGLEMLGQSAERLGQMSMAIHDELHLQNQILDDMDNDLDEANENLDFVTRKTKEFVEKAGGKQNCVIILTLSIIAFVLFFLILYS